jgi:hypothetical protein
LWTRRIDMRTTLFTALLVGAPRAALACPVCFGQNDSPMTAAANLAIIFMLVIVVGMLAAFASFFMYLMRRARMAAAEAGPDPVDRLRQEGYSGPPNLHAKAETRRYEPADAGPYRPNHGQAPNSHEGTV